MKTLHQSLLDHDMALLQVIAEQWAVSLTTLKHTQAARHLATSMLSPAAVAIILASLTEPEQAALHALLAVGGAMEIDRFAKQHGKLRVMGPARLKREQPWRNPVSVAEGLWYKGLLYKTFRVTIAGSVEMVYLPQDLLPRLQTDAPPPVAEPQPFTVSAVPPPKISLTTTGRLTENLLNLLLVIQNQSITTQPNGIAIADRAKFAVAMLPSLSTAATPHAELDFLTHLAKEADLIATDSNRLHLNRERTWDWLTAQTLPSDYWLQHAWLTCSTWNDLWHVPTLTPQPTGWKNDSLATRAKILHYLAQLPPEWVSIDAFIGEIRRVAPDFQRTDYDSWYLQDEHGNFLTGLDSWAQVEGALLRYLLTQLLPMLSVVDVGFADPHKLPLSIRLTPSGRRFLEHRNPEQMRATYQPPQTQPFHIGLDFKVTLPTRYSLYDRFQLARFASSPSHWEGGRADFPDIDRLSQRRVYYLTPHSLSQALRQRVTIGQIITFLKRVTQNNLPPTVETALREWANRWGKTRLENVTLLHLADADTLAALRQHIDLQPLLTRTLDPQTVILSPNEAETVKQILRELGYT